MGGGGEEGERDRWDLIEERAVREWSTVAHFNHCKDYLKEEFDS